MAKISFSEGSLVAIEVAGWGGGGGGKVFSYLDQIPAPVYFFASDVGCSVKFPSLGHWEYAKIPT